MQRSEFGWVRHGTRRLQLQLSMTVLNVFWHVRKDWGLYFGTSEGGDARRKSRRPAATPIGDASEGRSLEHPGRHYPLAPPAPLLDGVSSEGEGTFKKLFSINTPFSPLHLPSSFFNLNFLHKLSIKNQFINNISQHGLGIRYVVYPIRL
jgi:hypothetical protein